jgi:hypothetical protein
MPELQKGLRIKIGKIYILRCGTIVIAVNAEPGGIMGGRTVTLSLIDNFGIKVNTSVWEHNGWVWRNCQEETPYDVVSEGNHKNILTARDKPLEFPS